MPGPPEPVAPFTHETLMALIQRDVAPHTWGTVPRAGLDIAAGKLIATNLPAVLDEVGAYVALLHRLVALPMRLTLRMFASTPRHERDLPCHWLSLETPFEGSAVNPLRYALLSAELEAELPSRLGAPLKRIDEVAGASHQPSCVQVIELLHADPAPDELPAGALCAGLSLVVTPRVRARESVADVLVDLTTAVVEQRAAGLLRQSLHHARGRLTIPLNRTVVLRDVPNPFPDATAPGVLVLLNLASRHPVPKGDCLVREAPQS